FVDDHDLRPPDARRRAGEGITVARDVVEITVEVALQHVNDVIGRRAAAVEPLVNDRALLFLLREVVAIEAGVTRLSRVGQIDVCELAVGELVYKTAVSFYPGSRAQGLLVGHRDYRRLTRAFERWTAVDGQHGLPIRRAVEQTVDVVGRFQLNPID